MIPKARSIRSSAVDSLLGAAALALVVLAPCAAARAAGDAEEAKRSFERAETAYRLGKYVEAIDAYEAAYRALPEPAFLFNIAQSHRQQYLVDKELTHLQRALALYRTYLREAKDPPNRETVAKLIDELKGILVAVEQEAQRKRPGKLTLSGETAAGAEVRVDGTTLGPAPLSREVTPGAHFVQVQRAGFRPWSKTVTVESGVELRVEVSLERAQRESPAAAATTSKPLYKRWWFWTIIGAAAAAGTGTAIYFGTRDTGGPALPTIDLR